MQIASKMKNQTKLHFLLLLASLHACANAYMRLRVFRSQTVGPYHHPRATVYVPKGYKVVSGGAIVTFSGAGQLLTKSYPQPGLDAWTVESKDHLRSDRGTITAVAVALHDPDDSWDVRIFSRFSARAPHPHSSVSVAPGYTLVGGGANVLWPEPGNMLVQNYPDGNSWIASSKDHLRSAPASLIVYAIGIRSRNGAALETRQTFTYRGPNGHNRALARSPGPEYALIGGGARVTRGGVGNMLVSSYPYNEKFFTAYSKDHLKPDKQYLVTYGIFVKNAEIFFF